ncbi:hypothetical protein [Staphylothermus hellenicus]|uniref:Uncharacterized protein n=1 Tax=Staphylothermus hellenicus (strain DSM 12710 / JCM 10830 / BK20S6-10-b1 / P8) TaxID=591019 RepID=D7DAJ1_STAHD|nr:hypothetical protein [Staphylothermus hellenicus]ADI31188.1 hypothetical protein Shell_0036 [Staphylothermus hellenicus DSM 12710]
MVESKYVLYGLVSGAVSGLVAGILTYLTLPSVDAVLEQVRSRINITSVPEDILRSYISLGLILAPFIIFFIALILGALFGALYDFLDQKIPGSPIIAVLLTGTIYAGILVLPNIVLGGSQQNIIVNSGLTITYTLVLIALTIYKNPRKQG